MFGLINPRKRLELYQTPIETIALIQLCSSYSEYAQDNQN